MAADLRLVLYGNSVFLAGIKAELERDAALELITVEAGRPDVMDLIRAYNPRAALFDLAMAQPDFAVTLLRERPGLLLMGVDPASDKVLILSCHQAHCLTIEDLIQMIKTLPQLPLARGLAGNSPP
jgi:hypothetical protein